MGDQVFLIISIFLVVEILSQLFKFELIGKVFIQFYVVLVHLMITLALLSFESRELTFYFVTLIAFVNSIRFIFYKLPALQESKGLRFLFDVGIVGGLLVLLVNLSQYLPLETVSSGLEEAERFAIIMSLGLILFYEMFQRALELGLDVRDYLPNTLPSFVLVFLSLIGSLFYLVYPFFSTPEELTMIYLSAPLFIGAIVGTMVLVSFVKRNDVEPYSILYVLPTFVTFGLFISVFV